MSKEIDCDLCVIGAGSAGLSVAAGAAQLGLGTVLIEGDEMGGDCLNTGCVPSKSMLAAAKLAHVHRSPHLKVVPPHEFDTDRESINAHIRSVIGTIAPHDSQARFEDLGVRVIRAKASFLDESRLTCAGRVIRAQNYVIAAGSRAAIPPIEGLDPAKVLTNETIFDLETTPDHLIIIGAGPIGTEMAQAHRRLGARVTVLDEKGMLPKDDPDLVSVVRRTLADEGVEICEGISVKSVAHAADGVTVRIEENGAPAAIKGTHLLIATGRRANVEGLALDRAGIAFNEKGIKVDARLRTANKRVFAIGDIAGGPQFTHVAGYHAGVVIRNFAFRLPAKVDYAALPWVTYTDPELAHVGMTFEAARERYGNNVRCLIHRLAKLDRAVAEGRTEGLLKLVALGNGRILGCSIVAPGAGELISLWCLAIAKRMKLHDLAGVTLPYPTLSEVSKQAAGEWYKPRLFSDRSRTAVRWLRKLPLF